MRPNAELSALLQMCVVAFVFVAAAILPATAEILEEADEEARIFIATDEFHKAGESGAETVRAIGRPEKPAARLEASGYGIPASEMEAGTELQFPCLVKVGKSSNGTKPGSPASPVLTCWGGRPPKSSCPKLPNGWLAPHPPVRV